MQKKIEIKNLYKQFGPKIVLEDLNLDIYEGEILCILGKSGTGKSVVMKHLVGILEPDQGDFIVDNT